MTHNLLKAGSCFLAFLVNLAFATFSQAAVYGSLSFVDQTGTVAADESIEVWVTLTLDQFSDPIAWDSSLPFPEGIQELPATGYSYGQNADNVPFDSYDYIYQSVGRACNDTFVSGAGSCSGGPYVSTGGGGEVGAWLNAGSLELLPGEGIDFLLTVLNPEGGAAPAGTYYLPTVHLSLEVTGKDEFGGDMFGDIFLASSNCFDNSCAFTRTVVSPVPLPAAVWLLGSALLGLAGIKRRRAVV